MAHTAAVLDGLKTADLIDSPAIPTGSPLGIVLRTQIETDSPSGFSSYVENDTKR
ncbi:hypothetical protein [Streptodolium elevatio]